MKDTVFKKKKFVIGEPMSFAQNRKQTRQIRMEPYLSPMLSGNPQNIFPFFFQTILYIHISIL